MVGLVLGLMLSTQFRAQEDTIRAYNVQRVQQMVEDTEAARVERDALQAKVQDLRDELDEIADESEQGYLRDELNKIRMHAGLLSVAGPGVEVTLQDSEIPAQAGQNPNLYVLHDEDLLRVINELLVAGAEAIAINNERLVASSEVRCIGPAVIVNQDRRLTPPYVIRAIGDPDTLVAALEMRDGVMASLEFWGIQASIRKAEKVEIPAYTGKTSLEYGEPSLKAEEEV